MLMYLFQGTSGIDAINGVDGTQGPMGNQGQAVCLCGVESNFRVFCERCNLKFWNHQRKGETNNPF